MKKRRKRRKLKDVVFRLRRRVDQLGLEKTELVLEKAELRERLHALAELHERQVAGLLSRVEAEAAATARAKAERELSDIELAQVRPAARTPGPMQLRFAGGEWMELP